jgi:hypothetical protein
MELLLWLEETWLAVWVRDSNTILAYPTVLFLHTLGLSAVAGLSAFLSLRVLGFARTLPFAALTPFITAIWVAFAVTAVSGTLLLVASASTKAPTPVFLVKLAFVVLGAVTLHRLAKQVFRNPQADQSPLPRQAHVLAVSLMLFWVGATTAGRLMAYLIV